MTHYDFINLETSQSHAPYTVEYPFRDDGDTTHVIVKQPTIMKQGKYQPLPDTQLWTATGIISSSFSGSLYYIGDEDFQNVDNQPLIVFNRMWSNLPKDRIVAEGTYSYDFPAISGTVSGSPVPVSASNGTLHSTSTNHLLNTGDPVLLYYTVAIPGFPQITYLASRKTVLTTPTSASFTTTLTFSGGYVFFSGTVQKTTLNREDSFNLIVPSQVQYSYYLEHLNISSSFDIPIDQPFTVYDDSGTVTDSVAANTVPSSTDYNNIVNDQNGYIVAECAIEKYRGRMWQKKTTRVKAS